MATVVCFGAFDGRPSAYDALLSQALQHGDRVCVWLEDDASVLSASGQLPANSAEERLRWLRDHPAVDEVMVGARAALEVFLRDRKPGAVLVPFHDSALAERLRNLNVCPIHLSVPLSGTGLEQEPDDLDRDIDLPL